jgi:hypothetical protein
MLIPRKHARAQTHTNPRLCHYSRLRTMCSTACHPLVSGFARGPCLCPHDSPSLKTQLMPSAPATDIHHARRAHTATPMHTYGSFSLTYLMAWPTKQRLDLPSAAWNVYRVSDGSQVVHIEDIQVGRFARVFPPSSPRHLPDPILILSIEFATISSNMR